MTLQKSVLHRKKLCTLLFFELSTSISISVFLFCTLIKKDALFKYISNILLLTNKDEEQVIIIKYKK